MSDKNEVEAFFNAAKKDDNGEFVRIIFYSDADYAEFDPESDPKLAKMGKWCWNPEHDHLLLEVADAKNFDDNQLHQGLIESGMPVTGFEIRHIATKSATEKLIA